MFSKTLVTRLILRGFLLCILVINVYAEVLHEKEPSDLSNNESTSLISTQALNRSYNVLLNHFNEFSNYRLSEHSEPSYKSPWVAFLLSYIIPGCGQIYNGEIIKGLVFTGTFVLGAAIALIPAIGATSGSDWPASSYIGAGIAGIAYFWQLIDAPISASRINEENKQLSFFNVIVFDEHQVNVGLSTGLIKDVLSIGLKINYKVPIF